VIGEMVSKAVSQLRFGAVTPDQVYELSHRDFHLVVSRKSFQVEEIAFASIKAAQLLDEFDKLGKRTAMNAFLNYAPGKPIFGALYGPAFEAMVRRELPVRKFLETKAMNGDEGIVVPLPDDAKLSPIIFEKASNIRIESVNEARIWAPMSSNLPAFDFIVTCGAEVLFLNSTVSASHDIVLKTGKGTGLLEVVDALRSNGFSSGWNRRASIFVGCCRSISSPVFVALAQKR